MTNRLLLVSPCGYRQSGVLARSWRLEFLPIACVLLCVTPCIAEAQTCPPLYWVSTGRGCSGGGNRCCEGSYYYCGTDEQYGDTFCTNPSWGWCGEDPLCPNSSSERTACAPKPETCNDPSGGTNCSGTPNKGCASCKTPFAGGRQGDEGGDCCHTQVGADPLLISSRAAVTEPFTDFTVDRVARLSLTRTYNSSDYDLVVGSAGGVFGQAWHHDWESYLTCNGSACTLLRGTLSGFKFSLEGNHPSPDGTETWSVYLPDAYPFTPTHHNVLARRPSGEWIAFLSDGRELHFMQACTSCDASGGPFCTPVENGGRARLVKVVEPAGNAVSVAYDPGNLVLLRLTDDLGHALELRSSSACQAYASELRYDGTTVARYTVTANELDRVDDAGGSVLRSYVYGSIGQSQPSPRLKAVLNESGTAVAEFSYNSIGEAIGVVDSSSSAGVQYSADGWSTYVTEFYRGPQGDTSDLSTRELDYFGHVTSTSGSCSCGASGRLERTADGHVSCSIDAEGHATFREFDALGRATHRVEYWGNTCGIPNPMPADATEEWTEYGATKTVAQGVTLYLDVPTRVWRGSGLQAGGYAEEINDYGQASAPGDPAGYACTAGPLPAGSVVCRRITTGYVTRDGAPGLARYATYFSYDTRGRLIRTLGPVDMDQPGPNDVTPIEERVYWSDGASSERQGRLYQVKRYASPAAQPLVTAYDYDMFGVSRITAADGSQTLMVKDGRGRTTFVLSADKLGAVQATSETRYYDGLTARLRILPSGAAERYTYDTKGRLKKTEYLSSDPEAPGANPRLAWSESNVYDQAGNRVHSERADAAGAVRWTQDLAYDVQHHVVWESNPTIAGAAKTWSYSASGFLSGTFDEEGRGTSFTSDALNRVQKVRKTGRDASGASASADVAMYQYAANRDVLAGVTAGNGLSTTYGYDDFGRVERVTSANLSAAGAWYRYDARGNVVARGDSSISTSYAYDGLDRPLSTSASNAADGSNVSYQYRYDEDGYVGRLTSIVDSTRTTRFTYDWAGRLRAEVVYEAGISIPFTTQYDYDADGVLRQLTYPSGLSVQLERDAARREVVAVKNVATGAAYASNVTHLPGGPIGGLTYGNGRTLAQTFNARYEPVELHSGPLWLTYTPSPAGDVSVVADRSEDPAGCLHVRTRAFRYDFQDRLSGWSDAVTAGTGTCPSEGLGGSAAAFTYVAGTDRIASQLSPDGAGKAVYAFGYDGQGNVAAIGQYDAAGTSIARAVCLRHDALGRLVLVGNTGTTVAPGGVACTTDGEVTGALARFKYDAQNRRVARQVNSQWTYTVFDGGGNPLSEFNLTADPLAPWAKVRDYVWLEGRLLAQVEYTGGGSGPTYAYTAHVDHLGTPRMLTNEVGELVWSTFQRPYGEVREKTKVDPRSGQTVVTNLRLPGQYDERLLGSLGVQGPYYNWNRWYLPGAGRYLELDPYALVGALNGEFTADWYAYSFENPLTLADPSGLQALPATPPPLPPANGPMAGPGGGPVAGGIVIGFGIGYTIGHWWGSRNAPRPPPTCGPSHGPQPFPGWRPPFGPAPGGKCPPCIGPEEPPRIHTDHTHFPCGPHMHYSVWEQDPRTCRCFYKRDRIACL